LQRLSARARAQPEKSARFRGVLAERLHVSQAETAMWLAPPRQSFPFSPRAIEAVR
jgi:hypothetical protein